MCNAQRRRSDGTDMEREQRARRALEPLAPEGPVDPPDDALLTRMAAAVADAATDLSHGGAVQRRLAWSFATVAGALMLTGGLAAAGALPGPIQGFVSDTLDGVGVSVPSGDDATEGDEERAAAAAASTTHTLPPAAALPGLCNAYEQGQGGEQGGKRDSTAFQRLLEAAEQALPDASELSDEEKVADFCATVPSTTSTSQPSGDVGGAQGQGRGQGSGRGQGQGQGQGHGGDNPNKP